MMFFWVFIMVATLIAGMVFLPQRGYLLWAYNLLLVLLVVYLAFFRISGSPRPVCMISALANLHGDYEVVWNEFLPDLGEILLLIRQSDTPLYLTIRWSPRLYQQLATAQMEAEKTGGTVMVRSEILSRCVSEPMQKDGQQKPGDAPPGEEKKGNGNGNKHENNEGQPMFYAKPVHMPPEKQPPVEQDIEIH